MISVNYLSQADDGSSYYRMGGVMPFIKHENIKLNDISYFNRNTWASVVDCDILLMQRPYSGEHLDLIKMAKIVGTRVILDYDDLVTDIPVHNPVYDMYSSNKDTILECLSMADEIWVSTIELRLEFAQYNKNIFVIQNAHNDHLFPVSQKKEFNAENKIVAYRGGATHRIDIFDCINDLSKTINENKDYEFRFIGSPYVELETMTGDNHTVTNRVPMLFYLNYLYETNPAVMICPLQDTKFNRCKSNISFLEATFSGAAFIGKRKLPEFDHEFILNIDRLDMFKEYINPKRLKKCNEESWDYIKKNLLLSKINQLRIERLLA